MEYDSSALQHLGWMKAIGGIQHEEVWRVLSISHLSQGNFVLGGLLDATKTLCL